MVYKLHTLKRLYHLLNAILFIMLAVFKLTESMCGAPGISPNCYYQSKIENGEYPFGHIVTYYCYRSPCIMRNNIRRQCLDNGSWSGTIPFCHEGSGIENVEQLFLISGVTKIHANKTMDRNNSTCSPPVIQSNTHWEAVLKKSFRIIGVKILFPDRIPEITTQVQILEENMTIGNCMNHSGTSDIDRNLHSFICGRGVTGNKIRIIPGRQRISSGPEIFQICEVYLFLQSNQACLQPDTPYKSRGHKTPPRFVFECNDDYDLVGDNTVFCQDDGTWTPSSFKCQKKTKCGKLPEVANGVLKSNSTTINSTAWLECNEGYRPLSNHVAHCLPTGMWTSLSFSCEMIQCDPNPVIPHGKAELPNGAAYGSRLHITCDRGYVAVKLELPECQMNGSWGNLNICTQTICGSLKFEVTEGGQWLSLNETISIRVLICQTGYHIEGSPAVTQCLPNGSWSHTTAVCRKTPNFDAWNSDWTQSTVLLTAVAVGAGTAICILCLAMCFLLMKKRWQTSSNSTVFHVGVTDSILYNERSKEQQNYKANQSTYEDIIELRNNPSSTKPRKPSSALPHLPIFPVDTDPVYAQPFETSAAYQKTIPVSSSADIYTAHIYAEPVDSHRAPSGPDTFTSAAETWLRSGAKKFGRKMSLPGRASLPEDSTPQLGKNFDPALKPAHESSDTSSLSTRFDEKQKIADYEPKIQTTFSELISNSIYLDAKEGRFSGKIDTEQLQMIDNDIYQDDYFSNV